MDGEKNQFGGGLKVGDHEKESTSEAASALHLLRSLSTASASPENLERAFLDWARLSEQARTYPEFEHILVNLFGTSDPQNSQASNDQEVAASSTQKFDISDIFFIDENGTLIDISSELSSLLDLKVGDLIEPGVFQEMYEHNRVAEPSAAPLKTLELRDKFGLKRRVVLHRIPKARGDMQYAAVYIRMTLSQGAVDVLQEQHKLTKSELEILGLALQRYTPEHISKIRNSKLNTVRTHISRIISKTDSRSLNEAIGFALELSMATASDLPSPFGRRPQSRLSARKITLPAQKAVIDYSKYGPTSGRPVIVLHSLDYGFEPTRAMIDAARAQNACLFFPRRAGFGDTTPVNTIDQAANIISEFMTALDLSDVTVVALSTAAPLALAMKDTQDRVSQIVLVNYGLDPKGKIDLFEPAWIRGLIKMGLAAPASFAAAVEVVRGFWRTFGTERLYKMLYASVEADQKFLEENLELFENSSDILYKASRTNIRLDLMSSFMENRDLPAQIAKHNSILVANGERYFTGEAEALREFTVECGLDYAVIANSGRNWPFAMPSALFNLIQPAVSLHN